jgi:hypothetical protein
MMRVARARYKYKVLTRDINVLTVFAIATEPFTHCASRERSRILQGSSFRSSSNDNRVLHSIIFFECLDELRNSRALLTNGDIDAIELLVLSLPSFQRFRLEMVSIATAVLPA